ncbi:hypothetical protein P154DRAFT_540111 [Amniculicola lignicola CBS 123094]|uniref:Uncharacterized protein n=1 Tax=Amniculicola lignicola CBS 123094 TaxID=1392246 RepID=A0A6A5VWI9_9PLEO|nr:hypothetical protein P154DRAFT_540111 [Amniculicola lignicola CBS 123094]
MVHTKNKRPIILEPRKSILYAKVVEVVKARISPQSVISTTRAALKRTASSYLDKIPASKTRKLGTPHDPVTRVINRQFPHADAAVKAELMKAEQKAFHLERDLKEVKGRMRELADLQIMLRKNNRFWQRRLRNEKEEHKKTQTRYSLSMMTLTRTTVDLAIHRGALECEIEQHIEKGDRPGCTMSKHVQSKDALKTLWRAFEAYKSGAIKENPEVEKKALDLLHEAFVGRVSAVPELAKAQGILDEAADDKNPDGFEIVESDEADDEISEPGEADHSNPCANDETEEF